MAQFRLNGNRTVAKISMAIGLPCSKRAHVFLGALVVLSNSPLASEGTFFGSDSVPTRLPTEVTSPRGYMTDDLDHALPCSKHSVKTSIVIVFAARPTGDRNVGVLNGRCFVISFS